jgi:hypothetical protein
MAERSMGISVLELIQTYLRQFDSFIYSAHLLQGQSFTWYFTTARINSQVLPAGACVVIV